MVADWRDGSRTGRRVAERDHATVTSTRGGGSHQVPVSTLGLRPSRIAMRPNTKSSTPHTINDVVDEPVDGIVPLVLPPVLTFEFPPVTGVDAPTITKVTVRWALTVPVIVTV